MRAHNEKERIDHTGHSFNDRIGPSQNRFELDTIGLRIDDDDEHMMMIYRTYMVTYMMRLV